jgi:cyclopropane fatty-acyl-phospholipid synthase-like methyltransferase
MKTIEESILTAMDCTDKEVLPYLPYILQDFWEIGSDPKVMISLIKKYIAPNSSPRVLDLGCGKGVVSINIARQLNYECYGIDAIPEFISFAQSKANEFGVGNLCRFEVDDIREKIKTLASYDVIILGAIGQVFGNYFETLSILGNHLNEGGIIIIDDGYIEDHSNFKHEQIFSKSEMEKQINDAGMQLIENIKANEDDKAENYYTEYNNLLKRCQELSEKYPDKADIFIHYSNQQKKEYDNMETQIICSTMVVKRIE